MKKGFTLVEVLVVVLIIGILTAVGLPYYQDSVEKSRAAEAVNIAGSLTKAAYTFYGETEKWPPNWSVLSINIPGVGNNASSFTSKYFTFTATGWNAATGNFVIKATRTGGAYTIQVTITDDGVVTRKCTGAEICNAIANGHPTDGKW